MIKKTMVVIIALLSLLLCLSTVYAESTNLLPDPGFENSTTIDGKKYWQKNGTSTAEIVTEGAHSGTNAARLTGRTTADSSIKNLPINIRRNREYEYSAWVKVPSLYATTSTKFSLYAKFVYKDSKGVDISKWIFVTRPNSESIFTSVLSDQWTEIKCKFTFLPGEIGEATVEMWVYDHTYGKLSSEIWLDDYSIKPTDAFVLGYEGIIASENSDKTLQYTTNMSDVTNWTVTDKEGNPLTNGITIDNDGVLFIPANTSNSGEIIVTVNGDDTYVSTSLSKTVTLGVNKANIIKNSGFEDSVLGLQSKIGTPWFIWKAAFANVGGASDASFSVVEDNQGKVGQLSNRTHNADCIAQNATIESNRTYTYSLDMKALNSTSNTYEIRGIPSGKTAATTIVSGITLQPNVWTTITGDKKLTETQMMFYGFENVQSGSVISSELFIDNFSIIPTYVLNSIEISGAASLMAPEIGSMNVSLSATLNNQNGNSNEMMQTITWAIEGTHQGVSIDTDTGVLTVDSTAQSNEQIKIIASAVDLGVKVSGYTSIMIKAFQPNTVLTQIVNNGLATITEQSITTEDVNSITKKLSLPLSYEDSQYAGYIVSFEWISSNTEVITNVGVVTQNEFDAELVSLTVTANLNGISISKTFQFTVAKLINLIRNGDFENGTTNSWTATNGTFVANNTIKYSGNYSGQLMGKNSASDSITQEMPIFKNNRIYYISCFVNGTGNGQITLINGDNQAIIVQKSLENGNFLQLSEVIVFKKVEGQLPRIAISTGGIEDFYIDDFVINDITDEFTNATNAVDNAERLATQESIDLAKELVNKLVICTRKSALLQRVDAINVKKESVSISNSSNYGKKPSAVVNIEPKVPTPTQPKKEFADIVNHWAKEEIIFLAEKNIINGTDSGVFLPENSISRAEFATLIVNTLGLTLLKYEGNFRDVSSDDWYTRVVATIYQSKIMIGNNGDFRPNDNITREEMAKIIVCAYELKKNTEIDVVSNSFEDEDEFSDWSVNYIKKAVAIGFIKGMSETYFAHSTPSTRAQAAVIIKRLYERIDG